MQQPSLFRIGLGPRFHVSDGRSVMPEFDLSPLIDDQRIECVNLAVGPYIEQDDIVGLDALILSLEYVTTNSFPDEDRLSLIARFGVGYDRIDLDACTAHGVAVAITPEGVRRPVAVSVVALMLALTTKLIVKDRISRQSPDGWRRKGSYNGVGLVGRTLGCVGMGNIGTEVLRLAKPFDMRLMAHDPYVNSGLAESLGVQLVPLDVLFRESDIITIHCCLSAETERLVDEELLSLMKPTAYLINTARGPIVDQGALTRTLLENRIAGAALDVLSREPPDPEDPILKLDNVILSPHALCWTDQCLASIGAADVRAVKAVMSGYAPSTIVNQAVLETEQFCAKLSDYANRFAEI